MRPRTTASWLAVLLLLPLWACGGSERSSGGTPSTRTCGNGRLDPGEACDDTLLAGQTCESLNLGPGGLTCRGDCRAFDRSQCGAPSTCGNGVVDPVELCEGSELAGMTCSGLKLPSGTLACLPNCNGYDSSGCGTSTTAPELCGDGVVNGAEVCDGNDQAGASCSTLGYAGGTLGCSSDCRSRVTTGCTGGCTPDCSGRACGPDPACGQSCGSCSNGSCNAAGQCEGQNANGPPQILSFSSNVTTFSPNGSLIFSVIVTDPEGVDDVIGGQLLAPGGGTYGTFATAAAEGAYALTLQWEAVNQVLSIDTPPGGADRVFRAQFFDVAGHTTTADLTIRLVCGDARRSACAGTCWDLSSDAQHCGACATRCPSLLPNTPYQCQEGHCVFDVRSQALGTCTQGCADTGLICLPADTSCGGSTGYWAGCASYGSSSAFEQAPLIGCNEVPAAEVFTPSGGARPFFEKLCVCTN